MENSPVDMSSPVTLTEKMELLSSRRLRAAITTAVAGSAELRCAMEAALDHQLHIRQLCKVAAAHTSEPLSANSEGSPKACAASDISMVSEPNLLVAPLTPLYGILFDEEDEERTAAPVARLAVVSCETPQQHFPAIALPPKSACVEQMVVALYSPAAASAAPSLALGASISGVVAPSLSAPDTRVPYCRDLTLGVACPTKMLPATLPRPLVLPVSGPMQRPWRDGYIFFCRHDSFRETFDRLVFGSTRHKMKLMSAIEPGATAIFLFDQTFRYLHGVYDATCAAGFDLDPDYLRNSPCNARSDYGPSSPFPAQIRFRRLHDFPPLDERNFCHLVTYNDGTNAFRHRLTQQATLHLLGLFAQPESAPVNRTLPYESNGYIRIPEKEGFHEMRRKVYAQYDSAA